MGSNMFDSVFDRSSESLLTIIYTSLDECSRTKSQWVCTEHLLMAILLDQDNLAARALDFIKVNADSAQKEVDILLKEKHESEPLCLQAGDSSELAADKSPFAPNVPVIDKAFKPAFSQTVMNVLRKADEYSLFFGQEEIEPEHLLLALIGDKDAGANKVFEELSANTTFLHRKVLQMMAEELFARPNVPTLKTALVDGLRELVCRYENYVNAISDLAQRSRNPMVRLPSRSDLVHMVCVTYLSEFLSVQVAFQRYLLEENLRSLSNRVGALDKEQSATIVSSAAQNMRAEARSVIEHMWCNEYRAITKLLDEAEHDLIGSVLEDLWWAHSEEIALHDLFAEALDDHRRSHLMNLQKRRIEIAERLTKLHERLSETVHQCLLKRTISA